MMFLTKFNSSVEFTISLEILSNEGAYYMESSLLICNINLQPGFCMVENFSGGYSQTDYNFNFNINVNVTVDSNMNSNFNFSFSMKFYTISEFKRINNKSCHHILHTRSFFRSIVFFWLSLNMLS